MKRKLSNAYYGARAYFKPYNVVKCKELPATWQDRDELMLHAMFQILVDFVELEQPIKPWGTKDTKRFTDIALMKAEIEKRYASKEGRESFYAEWYTDEDRANQDKSTHQTYLIQKEILYLYEWYKQKKYNLDTAALYDMTGLNFEFENNSLITVPSGKPILMTLDEVASAKREHEIVCDVMLRRILDIRAYLWT